MTAENMLEKTTLDQPHKEKNNNSPKWILIPGASGGVGSALIQLSKLRGAKVIAVADKHKKDLVLSVGADHVISREDCNENLGETLQTLIGQSTVDIVADGVGGEAWKHLIEVISRGGYYTCCGGIAGPIVEFDLRTFYLNDLIFTGATVTSPKTFVNLVNYIASNRVKPIVGGVYKLQELHQAQEAFLAKKHVGNLIINVQE